MKNKKEHLLIFEKIGKVDMSLKANDEKPLKTGGK